MYMYVAINIIVDVIQKNVVVFFSSNVLVAKLTFLNIDFREFLTFKYNIYIYLLYCGRKHEILFHQMFTVKNYVSSSK